MDAIVIKVSLTYDSPISHEQLQELQDKVVQLFDSEANDGELALEEAEVLDFDVEVERSTE